VLRSLEGPVGIILLLVIVAIFAGPKLPGAAKGLAESIKIFRKEVKSDEKSSTPKPDAPAKSDSQDENSTKN
jgi:sec-independent protein translocase protein TatA